MLRALVDVWILRPAPSCVIIWRTRPVYPRRMKRTAGPVRSASTCRQSMKRLRPNLSGDPATAALVHLAFDRRRRSTFGEAGLTIEQVVDFLLAWATGPRPESPHAQLSSPQLLKLGAEELKVFYLEAVAARPGAISGRRAADWFWGETAAAHLLVALREVCIDAVEPDIRWMGRNLIVPRDQWSRFGIEDRWWKTVGRPSEASD